MPEAALAVTALYAGLNAIILFWLMVVTGRSRVKENVTMGDGGNPRMIRVMRGHANAIEIIPVALVLLLVLALLDAPLWALHGLGVVLTAGRLFHALHFTNDNAPGWQRMIGAVSSAVVLVGGGIAAIVLGLSGAF